MWMSNANMFKEANEKHSIRKCHISTLGHTYHSLGNEVFDRIALHESIKVPHEEVDKCGGESSIQATNEADALVELKNKHGENLLIDIEKTIKSNGCESRAKITLVSKIAGFSSSVGQREPALLIRRNQLG
ncbi:hypothetical protein Tco_0526754 [Tanacetum coccineum]